MKKIVDFIEESKSTSRANVKESKSTSGDIRKMDKTFYGRYKDYMKYDEKAIHNNGEVDLMIAKFEDEFSKAIYTLKDPEYSFILESFDKEAVKYVTDAIGYTFDILHELAGLYTKEEDLTSDEEDRMFEIEQGILSEDSGVSALCNMFHDIYENNNFEDIEQYYG